MKRKKYLIFISVGFLLIANLLYSQESSDIDELSQKLDSIYYKQNFDQYEIRNLALQIDYETRSKLYFQYDVDFETIRKEIYLNLIPSLGSWIVGNRRLAIPIDIGLVLGGAYLGYGLAQNDGSWTYGASFLIAVYIMNLLAPPQWAMLYNQKLEYSLGLDEIPEVVYNSFDETPKSAKNLFQLNVVSLKF